MDSNMNQYQRVPYLAKIVLIEGFIIEWFRDGVLNDRLGPAIRDIAHKLAVRLYSDKKRTCLICPDLAYHTARNIPQNKHGDIE